MFDKFIRVPKERLLEPLALGPLRVFSPASLTISACVAGCLAGCVAAQQNYTLALCLWLLSRLLDGVDGTLARVMHKQSDWGSYLDMMCDALVYTAVPLGLAYGAMTIEAGAAATLLFSSFYVNIISWSYLSVLLERRQQGAHARGELTSITMPSGLIEGTETVIFYVLFLLFPQWFIALFVVMAALVFFTATQRVWWASQHL